MEYDFKGSLWTDASFPNTARHIELIHRVQIGGSCVSTGLSLITHEGPEDIRRQINSQSPMSWSDYLQPFGWKLAYCNTDLRCLDYFVDELLHWDDLFVVCTYSPLSAQVIGEDPNEDGWICGSHFMLLQGDMVYDTRFSDPVALIEHQDLRRYVKRIFRVVQVEHPRGL